VKSRIILASRSPRRRELLRLLVPDESIVVIPPRVAREAGFSGLRDLSAIERRLVEIARAKAEAVRAQVSPRPDTLIVAADTIIVADDPQGQSHALGQPPDDETWPVVVRQWFRDYYAGRPHRAITALCVIADGRRIDRCVTTEVTFTADVVRYLDWYISTGEPRGKAGGYAIQGAGSVFVTSVHGSISNVIGLPLEALLEVFGESDEHVSRPH
jgi:septum formation protein